MLKPLNRNHLLQNCIHVQAQITHRRDTDIQRPPRSYQDSRLHQHIGDIPGSAATPIPAAITWQPPVQMEYKMNVDAAVNVNNLKIGIGAVVRNYKGEVVAALSKPIQGCFKSDEMEAKALFHSLNWAINQGLQLDIIETDALRVSSAVNSSKRDRSSFHDLINDVCYLLSSFSGVIVIHAKR